jgi:hypothetical protein
VRAHPAHAQATLSPKLAPDLANAVNAPVVPAELAKQTGNAQGHRRGAGVDPLLTIRNAVAAAVVAFNRSRAFPRPFRRPLLPSAPTDSISPNRPAKTASLLELSRRTRCRTALRTRNQL